MDGVIADNAQVLVQRLLATRRETVPGPGTGRERCRNERFLRWRAGRGNICGSAVVLATAGLAISLWSTSCGGGAGAAVDPPAGPAFSASSTTLTFSNQAVGATSAAQSATVTNSGNAPLTFSGGVQVMGPNASDYKMSSTCGTSLAPSAQCTVSVAFAPSAAGSRTASVMFNDNAAGSPQSMNLAGMGTADSTPVASLSPTSFTFTNQPATTGSSPQSFTLSNTGNATLNITSIAFAGADAGDFSQNTTCGATLAANANCTIVAIFTPAAAGSRSGTLVVTDNSNNTAGSTQSSLLAGTGTHDVMLSWTASSTPGVMGYYVFRATVSGAEGTTPLNSSPATPLSFVDTSVAGGTTYYYVVTAVASDGITQSSPSNEASAQVPMP